MFSAEVARLAPPGTPPGREVGAALPEHLPGRPVDAERPGGDAADGRARPLELRQLRFDFCPSVLCWVGVGVGGLRTFCVCPPFLSTRLY